MSMQQIVDDAIATLMSSEKPDPRDIMRLAMWIRFCTPGEEYRSACISAAASYVEQRYPKKGDTLQMNPALFRMSGDIINIDFLLDPHRDKHYAPFFPINGYYTGTSVHDTSEIADIVHFLIWYKPVAVGWRHRPSLNKAYWYASHHGFRGKSENPWKGFLKLWAKHRSAAGLIYAAEYLVDETWILDPMDSGFAAAIDGLCDRDAVLRLLAAAKAVDQALDGILHWRTRADIKRASIPSALHPAPLEAITLPDRVYALMSEYEPETSPDEDLSDYEAH